MTFSCMHLEGVSTDTLIEKNLQNNACCAQCFLSKARDTAMILLHLLENEFSLFEAAFETEDAVLDDA